jgi:hypothetical protein
MHIIRGLEALNLHNLIVLVIFMDKINLQVNFYPKSTTFVVDQGKIRAIWSRQYILDRLVPHLGKLAPAAFVGVNLIEPVLIAARAAYSGGN